ncbi:MAG: hypothetical protein M1825_001795 [Sarcosagium campestre]|nr:MAG: hypothetical protein M1825_001795 [Sarcosagium campestre]
MQIPVTSLLLCVSLVSKACAWGGLGHEAVAYVASDFVGASTKTYCQDIIGDRSASFLARVATWADSYRLSKAGSFSTPFHYIDALDNPPQSCGVNYDRDCGTKGCIVSAINNYTERLQDEDLSQASHNESLKFLVHFIGDIHQPLHDENLERGGNGINVTFDGRKSNLHSVWDSDILEKFAGGDSLSVARDLATNLTKSIKSGKYKTEASSWLTDTDISNARATSLKWAKDANAYICTTVLPEGASAIEDTEIDGAYYDEALPVIELQLAKAGYRLAAWLDLIATGTSELAASDPTQTSKS